MIRTAITAAALLASTFGLASAAEARRGFNGVQLNGMNFNGMALNGIKINGTIFNGVQLNGAVWNGAVWNGVAKAGTEVAAAPQVRSIRLADGTVVALD